MSLGSPPTCSVCKFPGEGEHGAIETCMYAWRTKAAQLSSYLLKRADTSRAAGLLSDMQQKVETFASMLFLIAKKNAGELRFDATELNAMARGAYRHEIVFDDEKNEVSFKVEKVGVIGAA